MIPEMYRVLSQCCEKYYDYLAHKYPLKCPDNNSICCGFDLDAFRDDMIFEIPNIFPRYGDENDQYALLDLIEYIAKNCRDFNVYDHHGFFRHDHISLLETDVVFDSFRNDINKLFAKMGLLFTLTEGKVVERIVENDVVTPEVEGIVTKVSDEGTRKLLEDAIALYRHPHSQDQWKAVEKIWDALESLKTHFPGIENNHYDEKLAKVLSNGESSMETLLKKELSELGNIGNNYSIRHFNDRQVEITDGKHYDYFFSRCAAFIALAIKYIDEDIVEFKKECSQEDELPF